MPNNSKIYDLTDTWNDINQTYTGIKLSVSDINSKMDSDLMDLSVNGSSRFNIDKSGNITVNSITSTIGINASYLGGQLPAYYTSTVDLANTLAYYTSIVDLANTAIGKGSARVGFIQAGANATPRTVQSKLQDIVSVKDFGAVGDGSTSDTAAVLAALTYAVSNAKALYFPAGSYKLTSWSTPTLSGDVVLYGDSRDVVTLTGSASVSFLKLNPGGSFSARNMGFDTWESACRLINNTGLAAFELLEARNCHFNLMDRSPITDYDTYNATGGIKEVRFDSNLITNTSPSTLSGFNWAGAIRLECYYIYSVFVTNNEIRTVGSPTANGQRSGIFLGGASFLSNGTYLIEGNRIYDVKNSANSPGGGTGHCSGITAFGRHVRVINNYIDSVAAYSANNTDDYAIYVKASYSTITGNHCYNAGGAQSTIMCKGNPNVRASEVSYNSYDVEKIIAHNTIIRDTSLPTDLQTVGITVYNSGHNIHDNNISGLHTGIVVIQPIEVSPEVTEARYIIHDNNIHDLQGTAGYTQCYGIQIASPTDVLIHDNIINTLGAGTEATTYAINVLYNTVPGDWKRVTIRSNKIDGVSASSTSSARGINVVFDGTAATSVVGLTISSNEISNIGRGINLSTSSTMTVSGIVIQDNDVTNASSSSYTNSGTATSWSGATINNKLGGVQWVTPASLTTTPNVFCLNRVRTINASATTITNFTGGIEGQKIEVELDGNTTIAHGTNIYLNGLTNWTPGGYGGTVQLVRKNSRWWEISKVAYPNPGFNDDFNRADGTVGNTLNDKPWIATSANTNWQISNNQLAAIGATISGALYVDAGVSNGTFTATAGGTFDRNWGMILRYGDGANYFRFSYVGGTSVAPLGQLAKVVAGVTSVVGTEATSAPWVAGDIFTIILSGSSFTIKKNGTTIITATDSDLVTNTRFGFWGTSGSGSARWDDPNFT